MQTLSSTLLLTRPRMSLEPGLPVHQVLEALIPDRTLVATVIREEAAAEVLDLLEVLEALAEVAVALEAALEEAAEAQILDLATSLP